MSRGDIDVSGFTVSGTVEEMVCTQPKMKRIVISKQALKARVCDWISGNICYLQDDIFSKEIYSCFNKIMQNLILHITKAWPRKRRVQIMEAGLSINATKMTLHRCTP